MMDFDPASAPPEEPTMPYPRLDLGKPNVGIAELVQSVPGRMIWGRADGQVRITFDQVHANEVSRGGIHALPRLREVGRCQSPSESGRRQRAAARIMSAHFSPIMIAGRWCCRRQWRA